MQSERTASRGAVVNPSDAAELRFRLVGVDCTSSSCTLVLGRHLGNLPGVLDFYVNPMDSMLTVRFDPTRTSADRIAVAVKSTGFRTIGPIMPRRTPPRAPP